MCINLLLLFEEVPAMTLPSEIKIVRQKTFLSQTAFAQELGVSYTTVPNMQTQKRQPGRITTSQTAA